MSSKVKNNLYHEILSMPASQSSNKIQCSKDATSSKYESRHEVDVRGSNEILSPEERHTLTHTKRQEPQGQEEENALHSTSIIVSSAHLSPSVAHLSNHDNASISTSSSKNNESNLSFGSSTNTLIIHHSVPDEPWSTRWLSSYTSPTTGRSSSIRERSQPPMNMSQSFGLSTNSHISESMSNNNIGMRNSLLNTAVKGNHNTMTAAGIVGKTASYFEDKLFSPPLTAGFSTDKYLSSTELIDIPSSYLDQSEVLKHLIHKDAKDKNLLNTGNLGGGNCSDQSASSSSSALNVGILDSGSMSSSTTQSSQHVTYLGTDDSELSVLLHKLPSSFSSWQLDTPPNYEKKLSDISSKSIEKNTLSKSQPDLTRIGNLKEVNFNEDINRILNSSQHNDDDSVSKIKEMLDNLSHENSTLRLEVDICHRKVSKLRKLEIEMMKVAEQHESLVKLCERREQLERLARHKLHSQVHRLTDINNECKEQIDLLTHQLLNQPSSDGTTSDTTSLRRELNKRDIFIPQLMSQNKELVTAKERQEIELAAQRQTLNEQRTHIDILDSALTNAQTNVVKLEEEVRKKHGLVEQVGHFKRILFSMKLSNDRREQSEKTLRQKLEMEMLHLKSSAKMDNNSIELSEMERELRDRDEKITMLEKEISKWEQKFMHDPGLRHFQDDTAREIVAHPHPTSKHNTSNSISIPFPKKDEELGKYSPISLKASPVKYSHNINACDSSVMLTKESVQESSQNIQEHSRSGSYCLFVNQWEQDEQKLEVSKLVKSISGVNLIDCPHSLESEKDINVADIDMTTSNTIANVVTASGVNGIHEVANAETGNEDLLSSRGDPPPYYSHHKTFDSAQKQPTLEGTPKRSSDVERTSSMILPRMVPVAVCQKPHPPNAFCRTCLNVRRSHRQNAAALVRRANSSGCQHNRRSAPSPASSGESLDDAPSILERLKKEWEMGILGGIATPKAVNLKKDRSKTLPPNSLNVTTLNTYSKEDKGPKSSEDPVELPDGKNKKDVSHLDRALNRLSVKRNPNQVTMKHSIKNLAHEDLSQQTVDTNDNRAQASSAFSSITEPTVINNNSMELIILEDCDRSSHEPKLRDKSLECLK